MEFQKVTASVRSGRGKGPGRRLRRDGRVPAVCYGPGSKPVALAVDPKELREALRGPLGPNTVLELTVAGNGAAGEKMLVMLHDHQVHPVSRALLHVDFLRVSMDRDVRVKVPLTTVGRAAGVQAGGVLTQVFREVPVRCKPDNIPSELTLDVTNIELGGFLRVSDLPLPAGTVVELEPNLTLVNVLTPRAVSAAEEAGVAEGEAAPAEGEAAAAAEGEEGADKDKEKEKGEGKEREKGKGKKGKDKGED